jgi:hypothetical protein
MGVQCLTGDGDLAATISVNVPEFAHRLGEGEFFLKDWSENSVAVKSLIDRGIIELVPDATPAHTGFVAAKVARLRDG